MDFSDIERIALDSGLTRCGTLDVKTLDFMPEVRDMCASGRCRAYGTRWTCPPACPSLDELRLRAGKYKNGALVQTVGVLEDEFDGEGMMETEKKHSAAFRRFISALKEVLPDIMPMGAGTCSICAKCSYPDSPCRFPDKVYSSMEACGLMVSDVCRKNDMPYKGEPLTIIYTGCVLY